jgi:hypothetical protein
VSEANRIGATAGAKLGEGPFPFRTVSGLRHATHAAGRNLFTEVRITNFSDRVDSAALMAPQGRAGARQILTVT